MQNDEGGESDGSLAMAVFQPDTTSLYIYIQVHDYSRVQTRSRGGRWAGLWIQYNTTLLPSVNTLIARGMFCGAKYTHHTFTPIIKHLITTTANKHPRLDFLLWDLEEGHGAGASSKPRRDQEQGGGARAQKVGLASVVPQQPCYGRCPCDSALHSSWNSKCVAYTSCCAIRARQSPPP